jgi:hypothetical protein
MSHSANSERSRRSVPAVLFDIAILSGVLALVGLICILLIMVLGVSISIATVVVITFAALFLVSLLAGAFLLVLPLVGWPRFKGETAKELANRSAQLHNVATAVGACLNSKFGILLAGLLVTTLFGGLVSRWIQDRESKLSAQREEFQQASNRLNSLRDLIDESIANRTMYAQMIVDDLDRPSPYADMTKLWEGFEKAYQDGYPVAWRSQFPLEHDIDQQLVDQKNTTIFGDYLFKVIVPGLEVIRSCLAQAHDAYLQYGPPAARSKFNECDSNAGQDQFRGSLWTHLVPCMQTFTYDVDLNIYYVGEQSKFENTDSPTLLTWLTGGQTNENLYDPSADLTTFYNSLPSDLLKHCGRNR